MGQVLLFLVNHTSIHLMCISGLQLQLPVNFIGGGVVSRQIIHVGSFGSVGFLCNGFTELRGFDIVSLCRAFKVTSFL